MEEKIQQVLRIAAKHQMMSQVGMCCGADHPCETAILFDEIKRLNGQIGALNTIVETMAYLMTKYQEPTTYALMDLSTDELEIVSRALCDFQALSVYGAEPLRSNQAKAIKSLLEMLERRDSDI